MALLMILHDLSQKEMFSLSCIHVNHHLREESNEEAQWLEAELKKLKVRLIIKDVTVCRTGSLEEQARKVRYQAFEEVFKTVQADVIALAHHADDQAETMLMRLLHGTGPSGLAAMREKSNHLWRPLLNISKDQLIVYLEEIQQHWLEDPSNKDTRIFRNAIRHQIMPKIETLSPGAQKRMANTARLLADEEEAWKIIEARWLSKNANSQPPFVFLLTRPLMTEPLAFRRRLVRRLCSVYGIELDSVQTNALCALPNGPLPVKINLPGNASALCTHTRLHISPPDVDKKPAVLKGYLKQVEIPMGMGDGKRRQTFDADQIKGAELRCVLPSDRIKPLGMTGGQSMSKYLSDRKIDLPFRRHWPVLAIENEVLWAIGLGVAQTAAVTTETKNRIQYVFEGSVPGDLIQEAEEA